MRLARTRLRIGVIALPAALALSVTEVSAHGGGLNAEGCHNDRQRGGYHCHRTPQSDPPVQQRRINPLMGGSSYYPNCAAARAAGVAPLRQGDPGYRAGLDRDGDGVACE